MSDYNWCHGPECHEYKTQDRIRGVKGSKVLRTKKIKVDQNKSMFGNGGGSIWDYFCNHQCLMDYMAEHTQAVVNIALRTEPLETPIDVVVETRTDYRGNLYKQKRIQDIDNAWLILYYPRYDRYNN